MPKIKELIQPPPEPEGSAEAQVAALRDYLVKITQELYYLLTHLEADNINDSTFRKISQMIPRPYDGMPLEDGEARAGGSGNWARGDHRHPHDTTKADATALAEVAESLEETDTALAGHVTDTENPHEVTKEQVGLGNVADERQYSAQNPPPTPSAADVGAIPASDKGSAGGVAELDAGGMVPSAQLPSYVDDVLEYPTAADFPVTGESGKIYVAQDTNRTYRWSGSAYVEISESLALGETSSTAYRGDRGKIAYDHSQTTGNPHGTTAAEVGAYVKPSGGIPKTDMASGVQTSLGKADTALQSVPNTYRTAAAQDIIDAGKQPIITASGILKGDGAGGVGAATAGTDYQAPLTAGTDYQTPLVAGTDYATPGQLDTKANQSQLATVESGSTASRAYAVGEYFCWNGLLYRATAAISSGGSFTPGTNCEAVTVGTELTGKLQLKRFDIAPGQTLTINDSVTYDTAAFLISTEGARQAIDSLHYAVIMGGRVQQYSITQALVVGSDIATSLTASGLTLVNNNATYTVFVTILVFRGFENLTFAVA